MEFEFSSTFGSFGSRVYIIFRSVLGGVDCSFAVKSGRASWGFVDGDSITKGG